MTTQDVAPDFFYDYITSSRDGSSYDSLVNIHSPETLSTPGFIDWQDSCHDSWAKSVPDNNAAFPFGPHPYETSSLDDMAVLASDNMVLENLVTPSSDFAHNTMSADTSFKAAIEEPSLGTASSAVSTSRVEKRKANNLAARRYRQNRVQQVAELQSALKATELERDALKVQVAKLQGENLVLGDLVRNR